MRSGPVFDRAVLPDSSGMRGWSRAEHANMTAEEHLIEAMLDELKRQAAASNGALQVDPEDDDTVSIRGRVDLAALAVVAAGSLAGGP